MLDLIFSEQTLWTIAVLSTAAFIQSTVGFAAALFGIPILIWVGNDLMAAQLLVITAMLPQNAYAVWKLRKSIEFKEVVWPASIRIAAMPIGIIGLTYAMSWSAEGINQLVGCIILFAIMLQALVGIEWKSAKRWYWVTLTFGGSGILQGLSGMSGPPMVLWVHGQRYTADRARAFLFAMYISNFAPQVALLWWSFGNSVWYAVGVALLSVPFVLISAALGLKLGSRLGDRWIRPLSYTFLFLLALSSLLEPWLNATVYPWIQSLLSTSS